MRHIIAALSMLAATTGTAFAVDATFLGASTYTASAKDCAKHRAVATGAAKRSLTTVPDTLSAKGYQSWEGGCTIKAIAPNKLRQAIGVKSWTVDLICGEGAIENQAVRETWRLNKNGSLTVSGKGKSQTYSVCAVQAKKR
jgi:hypothetical protein